MQTVVELQDWMRNLSSVFRVRKKKKNIKIESTLEGKRKEPEESQEEQLERQKTVLT